MTRKRTWLFISTLAFFAGAAAGNALAADPPVTQVPSPPMCRSQWGTPIPCPPSSTPATGTTPTAPVPRPMVAGSQPDLVVRELRVNERCQIVVTVANQGQGILPDHAWPNSLLAIGLRGAVAGTVALATVDPGHALRNPGGTATYVSGFTVPAGGVTADATVDYNNKIVEANERNNSRAGVLTCAAPPTAAGPLPDLVIRDLRLNERCEIVANVSNLGPGRVPDAVWTTRTPNSSSVYLTIDGRPWGGETIWKLDPRRALQAPHGHAIYVSNYVVRSSATVQATVDHTTQVAETNEGNNARTETLTCRGAPDAGGLPDLIPVLREPMDGSVGVRNLGAGRSGPTKLTLDCRKEGHTGGGGGCPDSPGLAAFQDPAFPDVVTVDIPALGPGREHIMRLPFWPSLRFTSGRYIFTATADAAGTERESDERNNVRRTSLTVR